MKDHLLKLGEAVPLNGWQLGLTGFSTLATTIPGFGLATRVATDLSHTLAMHGDVVRYLPIVPPIVGLSLAPFIVARAANLRSRRPPSAFDGLRWGPITSTRRDLYTSVLVLGATGSGKTSRVIFPAMEDLLATYKNDDGNELSKDPFQKLGGFILEVKGHFFETCVYILDSVGRNASTDIKVIRGSCYMPVAEFEDDQGRRFFLNAKPCSSGSEVSKLIDRVKFEDGLEIDSKDIADLADPELVLRNKILTKKEAAIRKHIFKVEGRDIRAIGWREKNGKWLRVKQTIKHRTPEFTGEEITPPKTLRFLRVHRWDNGLHFNLINPRLPASEAAARLAMLAKMSTGEGKDSGSNSFFYQAAEKQITYCIELQRLIEPDVECTVVDVYRLTTQDSELDKALKALGDRIAAMKARSVKLEKEGEHSMAAETQKTIRQLEDIGKYFTEEWHKLKSGGQTGSSINATISNLFGPFLRDRDLQATYCTPTTFSYLECMQKGTIFCFVPGSQYEAQSKTLGTGLKMEMQSVFLLRTAEGADTINTTRTLLALADECQQYIVGGGAAGGDARFMNLSRESRVINFNATQSESWVRTALGREESDVWLQSFGTRLWLQTTDIDTAKNAAEICGKIKRQKWNIQEPTAASKFLRKDGESYMRQSWEEEQRFKPHEFHHLPEDEVIGFNKGEGMASGEKARRGKVPFRWITSPAAKDAIADRMRWWFVETWENHLAANGTSDLINPTPKVNGSAAAQPSPPAPPPASVPIAAAPAPTQPATAPTPAPSSIAAATQPASLPAAATPQAAPPPASMQAPQVQAPAIPSMPPRATPSVPRASSRINWTAAPEPKADLKPTAVPVAIVQKAPEPTPAPAAPPNPPSVSVAPQPATKTTRADALTPADVERQKNAFERLKGSTPLESHLRINLAPAAQPEANTPIAKGPEDLVNRLAPPAAASEPPARQDPISARQVLDRKMLSQQAAQSRATPTSTKKSIW